MYNRGRDSMEFFMFINSTVHRGGFRAIRKRGVDTCQLLVDKYYIFYLEFVKNDHGNFL